MKPLEFSTLALPKSDRAGFWVEAFSRSVARTDVILENSSDCLVSARCASTSDFELFRASISSKMKLIRTQQLLQDADDGLSLIVADTGGFARMDNRGNEFLVGQRQGAFISHRELGGTFNFEPSSSFSVSIPRKFFAGIASNKLDRLSTDRPICDELLVYLRSIVTSVVNSDQQGDRTLAYANHHIGDIMSSIVMKFLDQSNSQGSKVCYGMVMDEITNNHRDPYLSAHSVAKKLRCSDRRVHYVLEEAGKVFSRHLMLARLTSFQRSVEQDVNQECSIAELAMNAGFSDISYFNRAFKSFTGVTPSTYRAQRLGL